MATLRIDKIEQETPLAIQLKDTNGKFAWLPKSQLAIDEGKNCVTIELPKWLAEKYPDFEYDEE